jgi:hypothetical protein
LIIYETNVCLGYKQLAYLIKLDESIDDYLCVGTNYVFLNEALDLFRVGEVVKNLESSYLTESTFDILKSPLYNTFLFKYFISNHYVDKQI